MGLDCAPKGPSKWVATFCMDRKEIPSFDISRKICHTGASFDPYTRHVPHADLSWQTDAFGLKTLLAFDVTRQSINSVCLRGTVRFGCFG